MESGVRLLEEDFIQLANKNIPIRILTGDYLNITQPSALTRGLEWNYRITKKQSERDFNHYKNTFNNLFFNKSICINDEELKAYSKKWVSNKKIEKREKEQSNIKKLYKPRGAQIEALYELKKTRLDNMDKALVVAATGIGKTYLAAF